MSQPKFPLELGFALLSRTCHNKSATFSFNVLQEFFVSHLIRILFTVDNWASHHLRLHETILLIPSKINQLHFLFAHRALAMIASSHIIDADLAGHFVTSLTSLWVLQNTKADWALELIEFPLDQRGSLNAVEYLLLSCLEL